MTERWSAAVTAHSDALDVEKGVFTWKDPQKIAESLKRSADASTHRKTEPYQSAISMLTFYINRGGSNLSKRQRTILNKAKEHLRALYNK